MHTSHSPDAVLNFWFNEINPSQWWSKSDEFDLQIANKFKQLHEAAAHCELYEWRKTANGSLAEVIILDQFSRNIYRNSAKAFNCDKLALALAQNAIANKLDQELDQAKKSFLYMPFMHSESKVIHEIAVTLFSQPGMEQNLDFEIQHKTIIDRFNRYPHRNAILNRPSTNEEIEFLKTPGSSF